MGTRSDIIVHRADGKWARIYCHWDGYLEGVGRTLFDHYKTQEKVEQLAALGDLSSIGPEIGEKHPFDTPSAYTWTKDNKMRANPAYKKYKAKYGDWCRAYGRDRGEKDVDAKVADTIHELWPEADTWTEFTYVWDDGKWWVGIPDESSQTCVDLGDALAGVVHVKAKVKAFGAVIGHHHQAEPDKPHGWTWYR